MPSVCTLGWDGKKVMSFIQEFIFKIPRLASLKYFLTLFNFLGFFCVEFMAFVLLLSHWKFFISLNVHL